MIVFLGVVNESTRERGIAEWGYVMCDVVWTWCSKIAYYMVDLCVESRSSNKRQCRMDITLPSGCLQSYDKIRSMQSWQALELNCAVYHENILYYAHNPIKIRGIVVAARHINAAKRKIFTPQSPYTPTTGRKSFIFYTFSFSVVINKKLLYHGKL